MDTLIRALEAVDGRLRHVHYRTSVALLLLRGGEGRFLPRATDELHAAVDELTGAELVRAATVSAIATGLGLDDDTEPTLTELIARAPAAAARRLVELQSQLRATLDDLHHLAASGTGAASAELEAIRRSLGRWSTLGGPTGYGVAPPVGPSRLDRSV